MTNGYLHPSSSHFTMTNLPLLYSLIFSVFMPTAWAHDALWPLSLIGYGVFAYALHADSSMYRPTPSSKMFFSFLWAVLFHLSGHRWVFTTLHEHTRMETFAALCSTIGFSIYLALFTTLPYGLYLALATDKFSSLFIESGFCFLFRRTLLLAACLTVGEWLRSQLFNGVTTLSLGYALIDSPLAGYAPLLGVYGLSGIGYSLSVMLALSLRALFQAASPRPILTALLITLFIGLGGYALQSIEWTSPSGSPLRYTLLNTHIDPKDKFNPNLSSRALQDLLQTIQHHPADLVMTPETALPFFLTQLPPDLIPSLEHWSQTTHSHVLLGLSTQHANGERYNSMMHLAPDHGIQTYNKVILMPLGEYNPWGLGWFSASLPLPFKDLTAGADPDQSSLFSIQHHPVGMMICHENASGHRLRSLYQHTHLLLAPNNLSWFSGTPFPEQNTHLLRFRALESGHPVLSASNGGSSLAIHHHGLILNTSSTTSTTPLSGTIQAMQGSTPYSQMGDYTILLFVLLIFITTALTNSKKADYNPLTK
jgi:apolipoprotein N-acyltransferase